MSTMGIIYCNGNGTAAGGGEREQLMLLRTLQDNERNIIGNTGGNRGQVITAKNNVSVISVNQQQIQQQQQQQQNENNEQNSRRPNQQQGNVVLPPYDPSRLKKHGKNGQPPPIAVAKRNARERNRVKQVNNGFATLRQHIPSHVAQGYGDRGKKLSKVETLRMAVEYIRGLQRLLAEADGLDYDSISSSNQNQTGDSVMIPSPSGSVYSSGTHNGSGDVLGLGGSELDEQHSAGPDNAGLDEDMDGEPYLVEEDDEEDENRDRRDVKRFRDDGRSLNRLSENHNRDRLLSSAQRRRRNSPSTFYVSRSASSFGDEENVEPLTPRNNNSSQHNNNNNNNHLLSGYTPILLQSSSPTNDGLPSIKREICLSNEDKLCSEDDSTHGGVILASPSPYTGEILIENPETGRLVPLKLEDPEAAGAQLVYLSAEGLPTSTYYKHEVADGAANGTEFMDVVNWWEQEQGRFVHHLQGHHHHHHHHHHAAQHQQTHQQAHQQLAVQQRLAHV